MQRTVKRVMANLPEDELEDLNLIKTKFDYSDSGALRASVKQYARILRGECGGCEA
jgi:hypothetical protein